MDGSRGYRHAEAFCLMTYRSDDGTEEELVWNSRDGVTPFVLTLKSGKIGTHRNWHADRYVPDYDPSIDNVRVFVDLTPERARFHAEKRVDNWLADPELSDDLIEMYGTRAAAIEMQSEIQHAGEPDLITAAEYQTYREAWL